MIASPQSCCPPCVARSFALSPQREALTPSPTFKANARSRSRRSPTQQGARATMVTKPQASSRGCLPTQGAVRIKPILLLLSSPMCLGRSRGFRPTSPIVAKCRQKPAQRVSGLKPGRAATKGGYTAPHLLQNEYSSECARQVDCIAREIFASASLEAGRPLQKPAGSFKHVVFDSAPGGQTRAL